MSNLLKDASILLTPTGYDNGRMNAIKPYKDLYGPELVTNGDFATNSDWTVGSSWTISGGSANCDGGTSNLDQASIVTNTKYKVTVTVSNITTGTLAVRLGGSNVDVLSLTENGTYTGYGLSNSDVFRLRSQSGFDGSVDNVSVVEDLSGDFNFERNSAATRVNAQGLVENVQILSSELVSNGNFSQIGTEEVLNGNFSQEGSELVTNGDFSDSSWWGLDASWTISGGSANCNGSGVMYKGGVLTIGKTYKVEVEVSAYTSGSLNYPNASNYSIPTSIGKHTFYYTAASQTISFTGNSFIGSIDNVSVKEVGQNWNLAANWSIAENKATSNGTSGNLYQSGIIVTGKQYKIQVTVSDYVSGTVQVSAGAVPRSTMSANGTYTFYQTASSTSNFFVISNIFNGSVTNISVKEVGQDWTFGAGWSVDQANSKAVFDYDSSIQKIYTSNLVLNSNSNYKLSFEIKDILSGTPSIFIANSGGSVGYNGNYTDYSEGVYTFTFSPSSNQTSLAFFSRFSDFSITNISVKEVTDDTDIPRINYSGFSYQDSLGSEEIVNGDFSNGTNDWSFTNPWSVSNKKAFYNSSTLDFIRQFNVFNGVIGTTYKITFDIYDTVGVRFQFKNGNSSLFSQIFQNGSYTFTVTTQSADTDLRIYGFVSSSGSIDNVSVKEYLGQEVVPDSGCGSWLLEPQRTNLITYSEDFSQSFWNQTTADVTVTTNTNPSGTSGTYSVERVTGSQLGASFTVTSGNDYTASWYVRNISGTGAIIIKDTNNSTNNFTATSEWQRFSVTATASSATGRCYIQVPTVNDEIEVWGAQFEEGSYATSYIPTNGATSTRLQDIANNSGNSSLINSTEGVLYAEISALADDGTNRIISLSENGNLDNRVNIFYTSGSNKVKFVVRVNNSNVFDDTITLSDIVAYNKIALKYKENDFAIWINGIKETEQLSGSTYSENILDKLSFDQGSGSFPFYGNTKALAVYKEALTDANLRCLTYPPAVATTFDLDFDTIAEQFTFTRGSEATFVNEQGLIESTNQIGPELVTNGDFATDSNWSKGPNWTISDGKANSDGSSNGQILQSNVFEANKTYQVTFTATKVSGSGLIARAFYGSYETILSITESGTYTTKFTPNASTNGTLYFISSGLFVGSIDNVSVKEVISATNTPRIDYSTGAKAFLLEPQSTNLVTYSEDFSQWTLGSNATLSYESDIVAPDGSLGVYRLTLPAQSSTFLLSNSFTGQNPLALSIYAKSAATNNDFNLFDGSITSSLKTATSEWQRFDYIGTGSQLGIVNQGDTFITDIYIWGAQSEALSYTTSYIPTSGASATRNQELCVDATPVINSEEGTLYAEIAALVDGGSTRSISLNDGTSNVVVIIRYRSDTNQIQYLIKDGINPDVGNTYTLTDSTNYSKIALKYKNNDITFWVDGSKIFTSTSPISLSNLNNLSFDTNGANPFFGNTKGLKYYPKALADVQLEDLTTI